MTSKTSPAWQDSLVDRGRMLNHLLISGDLSDVTLEIGKLRKHFKAHTLILASRSSFFEDFFYGSAHSTEDEFIMTMEDEEPLAVQWILQHIYCDLTEFDNMDLAFDVLRFSDKFRMASAYEASLKKIEKNVRRCNILKLYKRFYNQSSQNQAIVGICEKIFSDNGNSVLASSSLQEMTSECLQSLLQETLTVTSEVVIFKALLSWCHGMLKRRREPVTPKSCRRELLKLLPSIRFLTMTSEEFVQNVVMTDVLTPEESIHILKIIARTEDPSITNYDHSTDSMKMLETLKMSFNLSNSFEKRPQLIMKDKMRTCTCDEIHKTWLRDREYEFFIVVSDNIVLLAFKLQIDGEMPLVKVEITMEDANDVILATGEGRGRDINFKNPVHFREGVSYRVKIATALNCRLFGSSKTTAKFTNDGFHFTFRNGIFLTSFVFI